MRITLIAVWINLTILGSCFFFGCAEDEDNPLGGGPEPLPVPVYFDHPAWHPEGKWIAVEHSDSIDANGDGTLDHGFSGIWLINSDTGEKQPLISGYSLPAWSHDGKFLAMVQASQIFTVQVISLEPAQIDSNSLTQLTFGGRNFYPAWSPDGQWIAYDSNVDDSKYDIWLMKSDGESKKNISGESDSSDQGGWRMPNWSPNGQFIVHHRYVGVNVPEIVVMDILGQNSIRLTFDDSGDYHPKYSHDGTEIAFYSQPRVGPPAIWKMNYDGSSKQKVSPDYAWRFDWSPDGRKFVFLYLNYDDRTHSGNGQLWLINTDGSGLTQLTHFSR